MINSDSQTSNLSTETADKLKKNIDADKFGIVRIIARLNVGGPARHVVWLTKALQNNEYRSTLIAGTVPEGEEDMSYFAAENQVAPVYIEEMSRELSPKDVISLWKVYRCIRREKPDVIHTHTAKAGTIGRVAGFFYRWLTPKTLIGKPRRVALVHTYHGHVFHSYYGDKKTKVFLFIEKTLARIATDKIVVISRQQFNEIHHRFGVGAKKQFEIIPLGIDLEPFAAAEAKKDLLRREIGIEKEKLIIGFVGRLTEIKNVEMLIDAVEKIAAKDDESFPPFVCVIIGDGHLRESLEKKVADAELQNVISFLGSRSDTDVFYAGLDIVALTSLNEGTPLSLIEAMANGKAVVSTAVGGVIDLLGAVTDDKGAFQVCERGIRVARSDHDGAVNADRFGQALMHLAENDALRSELGENGRKFVAEQYGKERLISDITRLYSDLRSF